MHFYTNMTAAEVHARVAQEISETSAQVLPWFDAPQPARAWLPPQERWSIDEILHHITLTSHYLLILIDKSSQKCLKAKAQGNTLVWPADYTLLPPSLQAAGELDAFSWHRPDHMDPRLHPPTGDVREHFVEQMQRCEAVLASLAGGWGIQHTTMMTVNNLGKLDVYQYLVFLCRHAQRHCQQMQGNLLAQQMH
jgi:hypothetical protein